MVYIRWIEILLIKNHFQIYYKKMQINAKFFKLSCTMNIQTNAIMCAIRNCLMAEQKLLLL